MHTYTFVFKTWNCLVLICKENYYLLSITVTWWNKSQNWNTNYTNTILNTTIACWQVQGEGHPCTICQDCVHLLKVQENESSRSVKYICVTIKGGRREFNDAVVGVYSGVDQGGGRKGGTCTPLWSLVQPKFKANCLAVPAAFLVRQCWVSHLTSWLLTISLIPYKLLNPRVWMPLFFLMVLRFHKSAYPLSCNSTVC